jgi:uncharacterized membrane protein YoaK (UPF0700 family)
MTETTTRDLRLMALTFSSGAIDAISFLALGKLFTAFMTGNLVFLGLALEGTGGQDVGNVGSSLLAFAAGVFLGTRSLARFAGSETWPSYMSLVLGGAAIAQAAVVALWVGVSGEPSGGAITVLIILAALAMGMQSAAVMSLGVTGVFTTAATATLMFLNKGAAERSASPSDRRRLASVLVALIGGAAAGALLLDHARIVAPLLPLTVTVIVVATGLSVGRASVVAGTE